MCPPWFSVLPDKGSWSRWPFVTLKPFQTLERICFPPTFLSWEDGDRTAHTIQMQSHCESVQWHHDIFWFGLHFFPNIWFAFLNATEHWADIFIDLNNNLKIAFHSGNSYFGAYHCICIVGLFSPMHITLHLSILNLAGFLFPSHSVLWHPAAALSSWL